MEVSPEKFIEQAFEQLGAPYIWTGKGDYYVTPEGRVMRQVETRMPLVFDCSGLVTWALLRAGGSDLRASWNAQKLHDACEATQRADEAHPTPVRGRLRFYGKDRSSITHVSILLGREPGRPPLILDASGGDSLTRSLHDAVNRDAKVRVHFDRRGDFVFEGWLPFLDR